MPVNLNPGALLGRYRLESLIATGGMGAVWRARDEGLGREVAVKVLPEHLLADDGARRRFEREARVTAALIHPNVVTIFDVGSADAGTGEELPFLVMELLEGRSLFTWLRDGPVPLGWMVKVATQIASALGAAHERGVIHRDLKPSNVMVLPGDHVKVLDFGLARLLRTGDMAHTTLTTPGMVLGSCPYMSPEQALGEEIGPASDIFALGAVMYEMLAGRRAFRGGTPVQVLEAVVKGRREPLDRVAPDLPSALVAIVERCLEHDTSRRYPDGAALERDLALLDAGDMEPQRDSAPTLRAGSAPEAVSLVRRKTRRRTLAGVTAASLAALLFGLLAGRWGREPLRPHPGAWTVRTLATVPGLLRQPAWSPDGGEIAVNHLAGGHGELLVVDVERGFRRLLASAGPGEVFSWPRFSPGRRLIAVTVTGGPAERVEVVPAVGGPPVFEMAGAARAAWQSEGVLLVARYREGRPELWRVPLEGGQGRPLLEAREAVGWWDARPGAGGRLALLGGAVDVRGGLWVMDPRGRLESWLPPGGRLAGFDWAPGGRALVAVRDGTLIRVTPGRTSPVLPPVEGLMDPAVAPDGVRLALVRQVRRRDVVAVDPRGGRWECRLCGVEGVRWASAAPDGSILYSRQDGGAVALFRRTVSGREVRLLAPGESGDCPVADPSGRLVAYIAAPPGKPRELRVAGLDGGTPVTLAGEVEGAELPSWSPDGSRIAYAAGSPLGVWVAPLGGGEPVRLADGDYPRWSPAGGWIAYLVWTEESDPDQGVWVVRPDGAGARKIGSVPGQVVWARDGGSLWQLRRAGERLELWSCRSGDWRWRRVGPLDLGGPAYPYQEFLPFTVEAGTGKLLVHLRRDTGELVVFQGLDPRRW